MEGDSHAGLMGLQEWYARLRKAPFSTAPSACLGDKRRLELQTCGSTATANINGINTRPRNMAVEVALALGDGLGGSVDGELIDLRGRKASRSGLGTRERLSAQNISVLAGLRPA